MPYIQIRTNRPIAREQSLALKDAFGEAISIFPGKTEHWLMVECNGERDLYFHGSSDPCAMVQVELFGSATVSAYDRMTRETCRILEEILGLSPDAVYITYREVDRWGWNSGNF